jgi:hypothetical protein
MSTGKMAGRVWGECGNRAARFHRSVRIAVMPREQREKKYNNQSRTRSPQVMRRKQLN